MEYVIVRIDPSQLGSLALQLLALSILQNGCESHTVDYGADPVSIFAPRYFVQGRRRWVRLHEKGGKEHDVPCRHRLDQCLHDYIEGAGIAEDIDVYLFRSARRKTGQLTANPLFQQDAHRIVHRRAKAAGIETRMASYLPRDRHHGVSEEQR